MKKKISVLVFELGLTLPMSRRQELMPRIKGGGGILSLWMVYDVAYLLGGAINLKFNI